MTNHTTTIEFVNSTFSDLASQTYSIDTGLTPFTPLIVLLIIYSVAYYTKNFPAVLGSGAVILALGFTNIPLTGLAQINHIAILLLGVSIIYTAIYSVKRYMNQEARIKEQGTNNATNKSNS